MLISQRLNLNIRIKKLRHLPAQKHYSALLYLNGVVLGELLFDIDSGVVQLPKEVKSIVNEQLQPLGLVNIQYKGLGKVKLNDQLLIEMLIEETKLYKHYTQMVQEEIVYTISGENGIYREPAFSNSGNRQIINLLKKSRTDQVLNNLSLQDGFFIYLQRTGRVFIGESDGGRRRARDSNP